jgi:spore coat protein A, manganese oxidase
MATRRDFLKLTALASAACGFSSCGTGSIPFPSGAGPAKIFSQSPRLRKFISPLPGLGTGIPLASATTSASFPGVDLYNFSAVQYQQLMHPDLPNPTTLWGYQDQATGKAAYLGPVIAAQRGRPVMIRMKNGLPSKHPLPVDTTLMGADNGAAQNRITVHLHGGLVPWTSDGGPFSWFTPNASGPGAGAGECFLNGIPGTPGVGQYYYPNNQSARLMWYHDHSIGITRLNAYAGLASGYLVNDDVVTGLINAGIVPGLTFTVPLIIQDKSFKAVADQWGKPGDLWYPSVYEANSPNNDTGRWDIDDPSDGFANLGLPQTPSCVPEFFPDTPVINGEAYPYLQVQPRRYRVVVLNGSQARFYNLNLFYENKFTPGEPDFGRPGPSYFQIGNEGGILPAAVAYNTRSNPPVLIPTDADDSCDPNGPHNLLMAPAERADLIIDFSSCQAGDRLILYNDAPAPFPGGDSRNDYFTGNPDQTAEGGAPTTKPGYGANSRTLMQIQVVALQGANDQLSSTQFLNALPGLAQAYHDSHVPFNEPDLYPLVAGITPETKTLNEDFDSYGRLIQRVGTGDMLYPPSYGRNYIDAPTEVYHDGQIVVWDIYNTTGDTHPMHFHLTNVQVIGHAPFTNVGTPDTAFQAPDANYAGWKETVRMNPGEVTRVIMQFSLPASLPPYVPTATSPRFPGNHEYVWHCHILEHEEHDMMRPLVIIP